MSRRRRVLLLATAIEPRGGGHAVAAWMLEALRKQHDVTLLTQRRPRFAQVDALFGTSLADGGVKVELAPEPRAPGLSLALWRQHQLFRAARSRHTGFDVVISNENETWFGRRCIQYVHYPWAYPGRREIERRWFHLVPGALALYRAGAHRLSGYDARCMTQNLTLANSEWTAGQLREFYAMTDVTVLPPPVVGAGRPPPWPERRSGFVMVGRFLQQKRIELAVEILERVRASGHDVTLDLVGTVVRPHYHRLVARLASDRPWLTLHEALPRAELSALLLGHRYGIHAMLEEHFGMVVAEMLRAGCIPFAHDSGGPPEILADARLLYRDVDDAVAKVRAVLESPELQAELGTHVERRAASYSEERFMDAIRELVATWDG